MGFQAESAGGQDRDDTHQAPALLPLGSTPATWDLAAGTYDAERADDLVYQACLITTARVVQGLNPTTLLDVGCGTGLTTLPLCQPNRRVVAVDYSARSLAKLRDKPGAPPVLQADIRALPLLSRRFDVVLCANTLQHLPPASQALAIRELRRLVSGAGTLVVTVHHYSKAKQRAGWIKEGRPGQPGIDYIYRFTADELRHLLPGAWVSAMGFSEWPRMPVGLQARLSASAAGPQLARWGYGHMLVAVASDG